MSYVIRRSGVLPVVVSGGGRGQTSVRTSAGYGRLVQCQDSDRNYQTDYGYRGRSHRWCYGGAYKCVKFLRRNNRLQIDPIDVATGPVCGNRVRVLSRPNLFIRVANKRNAICTMSLYCFCYYNIVVILSPPLPHTIC